MRREIFCKKNIYLLARGEEIKRTVPIYIFLNIYGQFLFGHEIYIMMEIRSLDTTHRGAEK